MSDRAIPDRSIRAIVGTVDGIREASVLSDASECSFLALEESLADCLAWVRHRRVRRFGIVTAIDFKAGTSSRTWPADGGRR